MTETAAVKEARTELGEQEVKGSSASTADVERNASAAPPYSSPNSRKIGPFTIPGYATPATQLVIVAFVCFLCPGMFNAINGIGAGGQVDPGVADRSSAALYATFSIVGFFAGGFVNRLGIKATLSFGGIGYVVYIASFLCFNHTQNAGFVIFAGALLGVCAGLLWTAQGTIMMSYPQEADKGKYISWFWMIFNLGAVIGSLIPLGENINNHTGTVTDGTYIGFIVLMLLGAVLALCLVDADKVIRKDGSRVITIKNPTWQSEFKGMFQVFMTDWYILLFFPMFFFSNFFYTYQFNVVNLFRFNLRTRSLNGLLYWLSQIVGAYVFGYALDYKGVSRRMRARAGLIALFVITMAIWGGGYAFQMQMPNRPPANIADQSELLDWTTAGYVGPMFLYMFYGFFDAAWQTTVYWFMGSLSNNSRKLANFAGFYKGIQSAGSAGAYGLDASNPSLLTEFAVNWGALAASLVIAAPVILLKIQDHIPIEDDIVFSDETVEEVAPAAAGVQMTATEKH